MRVYSRGRETGKNKGIYIYIYIVLKEIHLYIERNRFMFINYVRSLGRRGFNDSIRTQFSFYYDRRMTNNLSYIMLSCRHVIAFIIARIFHSNTL